jgi:peptidoglycan/LPS O-acetylase OafA/YrhL
MGGELSQFNASEHSSSEGPDTYFDSDFELAHFLHDSRKVSVRSRLTSAWKRSRVQSCSAVKLLPQAGLAILPSYIKRWILGRPAKTEKLYPTSALDDLRGVACYFVFNFHLLFTYSNMCQFGYGFGDNKWFHRLPFLRLIYAGPAMVAIFFVISGYVLSHKPLKLTRKRSWDQVMLHTVSSSVFRRALRLLLPTIIGTFITMLLVQAGMFKYASKIGKDGDTLQGNNEEHPPYFDTFMKQFWDWQAACWRMTDPWNWGTFYNMYDPHLWTIPVEFRSSIVLFLTIVGLAKLRSLWRLVLLSGLIWYCILSDM